MTINTNKNTHSHYTDPNIEPIRLGAKVRPNDFLFNHLNMILPQTLNIHN